MKTNRSFAFLAIGVAGGLVLLSQFSQKREVCRVDVKEILSPTELQKIVGSQECLVRCNASNFCSTNFLCDKTCPAGTSCAFCGSTMRNYVCTVVTTGGTACEDGTDDGCGPRDLGQCNDNGECVDIKTAGNCPRSDCN